MASDRPVRSSTVSTVVGVSSSASHTARSTAVEAGHPRSDGRATDGRAEAPTRRRAGRPGPGTAPSVRRRRRGPARTRRPAVRWCPGRPGCAPSRVRRATGTPRRAAASTVWNDPPRPWHSTTTTTSASAAMMRLRAGKTRGWAGVPSAASDSTAPRRGHPLATGPVGLRVDHVEAGAHHGHRRGRVRLLRPGRRRGRRRRCRWPGPTPPRHRLRPGRGRGRPPPRSRSGWPSACPPRRPRGGPRRIVGSPSAVSTAGAPGSPTSAGG